MAVISAAERAAQYTIRDVRPDDPGDAAGMADLWNAADSLWPEGLLTRGVPMTAQRMREQLRWQNRILALVVEAGGEILGYIDVTEVPGRDDVAQISTVTVRPDWLSKGCGKAMLLAVLDRLRERGYRQCRWKTWGGNERAIPLYKKVGSFWQPGTSVWLQNFIPLALTLPVARGFFERHDWYRSLHRDLTIAPDAVRWHGIGVYPYRFEADDDLFLMVIDRQAEAPTAIETNDVYLACYAGCEEVACGLPHTLTWEITNKRRDGQPLRVELVAEGPPGVELSVGESFEVTDSLRIERQFIVSQSLEPPAPGLPQHAIRSTFRVDGLPVELSTGIRAVQPMAIDVQGLEPTPGKPQEEVVVRLYNRLQETVAGAVSFEPTPGLSFDCLTAPFTVPAGSWGSCRFRVTATEGAHATRIRASCPPEQNIRLGLAAPLETRPQPVTFRSIPLDRVYAWQEEGDEVLGIETPTFWVRVHLRDGSFSVHERLSGQQVLEQGALTVGPPFNWHPELPRCRHRLERADGQIRLALEIPSDTLPGVTVERTLTVGAGPFLRLDHRAYNTSSVDQRPKLQCPGKIHLHRGVTVPLAGGLVHEIVEGVGDFLLPDGEDLPKSPAAYSEGWSAWEEHGLVAGIVWRACSQIHGASVQLDLPAIPPQSFADADPLHLVVARGDWEVVRGLWRWLWQPGGVREEQRPAAQPVLSAGFEPSPLLVAAERTETVLVVRNRRLKAFNGRWELRAGDLRSDPAGGELSKVARKTPARQAVTLTCTDLRPRVVVAAAALSSEATEDERETPIVVLGDAGREVSLEPIDGGACWKVDNGALSFAVAPGHHGSLVSLRSSGRELLISSFPEPRPFQWMSTWFGGVEPFLNQPGDVRHVPDSFTGGPVERCGARGLTWRGVRVSSQVRHPAKRWLTLTVEYLTLGTSNLVALVQRLTNGSGAPQEVPAGFIVFPVVTSGTRVRYEVRRPGYRPAGETGERDTVQRQRAPTPASFRFGDAHWVAMDTEGSALTLVTLLQGEAGAWLLNRQSAGLHTSSTYRLEPGETRERLAWLAVTGDPRQARAYQVLGTIGELP